MLLSPLFLFGLLPHSLPQNMVRFLDGKVHLFQNQIIYYLFLTNIFTPITSSNNADKYLPKLDITDQFSLKLYST